MKFVTIVDRLNYFIEKFLALILMLMSVIVLMQVLVRFIFVNFSVPWSEELAKYLMIWLTFIGSAVATRKAKLISIDSLILMIPEKFGKLLKYIAHIISIVFYIILLYIGIKWFNFGLTETSPVLKISKAYVYSAMLLGAVLMIINSITFIVEVRLNNLDIRGGEEELT